MKIAFIGAHGTGKTTLAHELVVKLKKKGLNAEFLGEIVRDCPFPINEGATKKSQMWIILNQIIKEFETEDKCDVLVCDRSVLDGYVYYTNKFGRASFLEPLILKHLKTYTHLIRVPIREGFLRDDKIRSVDSGFQKEINDKFNELLNEFGIIALNLEKQDLSGEKEIVNNVLRGLI